MLDERIALVTGGAGGIGSAIARALVEAGATVIVTDIDNANAERGAAGIGDSRPRHSFHLDVTDAEACNRLADRIAREIGDVSILVNNAGICPRTPLDSPDLRAGWDAVMTVNLSGTFNVTMALLPALRRTKGAIINISSTAAVVPSSPSSIGYPVSKSAIWTFTQGMANLLAPEGVRVNAIAPGQIRTAMTEVTRNNPERYEKMVSRIPMGRYGEPEEIGGPVVFLASPLASYVTGSVLVVDGGFLVG